MFALQTNPVSPTVLNRVLHKILMYFDSRDVYHCPVLFSRSTTFSSPLQLFAIFGVRVYVSRVSGGSLTNLSIPPIKVLTAIHPIGKPRVFLRMKDKISALNVLRCKIQHFFSLVNHFLVVFQSCGINIWGVGWNPTQGRSPCTPFISISTSL